MLSIPSNLNSNLALTLGYLNPALNNSALEDITEAVHLAEGLHIKCQNCDSNVYSLHSTRISVTLILAYGSFKTLSSDFLVARRARGPRPVYTGRLQGDERVEISLATFQ